MLRITNRLQSGYISGLCAALLLVCSASAALAQDGRQCSAPALAFLTGSSLHVSTAVDSTAIGDDRIALAPYAVPPDDALVSVEGHPHWGRIGTAAIISASQDEPQYLPNRSDVPMLRDYFVIYLEKAAPAGSEFADYVFHSDRGLSAGYHLVHAEVELQPGYDAEPTFRFTVVDIDQPIANDFERGVTPTGLNL